MPKNKTCSLCRIDLPLEEFHVRTRSADGRHSWCKPCCKTYQAAWYERNRDTVKVQSEAWHQQNRGRATELRRRSRYGITPDDMATMMGAQEGACAICGVPLAGVRHCIDHDHACCPGERSCGKCVRGVLCSNCNTAIGMLCDDPMTLWAAIEYLEKWAIQAC